MKRILDAIFRSQDIVQRGVRGVIAEAVFDRTILPAIKAWKLVPIETTYLRFLLRREYEAREITSRCNYSELNVECH